MSQKLGWNANNAGISSAQARVSGDQEMQGMLELLARAKLVGANNLASHSQTHLIGPLTGPAAAEDALNVFDMSFVPRSQSPDLIGSPEISPSTARKTFTINESIPEQINSSKDKSALTIQPESEVSSGTLTNESQTTSKTSPPATRRQSLRRTYTDIAPLSLQTKLMDALAQPYVAGDKLNDLLLSPSLSNAGGPASFIVSGSHLPGPAVHGHSSRWAPAAQAIFTTEITPPYTILAANDLACLVFGVTKAEVRKMGILEVVREERRAWLTERLEAPGSATDAKQPIPLSPPNGSQQAGTDSASSYILSKSGLTASLLSKPNSRQSPKPQTRRAQTDDGVGSSFVARTKAAKGGLYHSNKKSRGVLLCGDVVPIQKRNGATGSASLWVKEKRGGLIWVLEEIHEDVAYIGVDDDANVSTIAGSTEAIWGEHITTVGMDIGRLIPRLPRQGIDGMSGEIDYAEVTKRRYFTARNSGRVNIPCTVERVPGGTDLQVSSFPHIAGIMVLSAETLKITSSNSVFSAALFGQEKPDGGSITDLIPDFDRMLKVLTEHDNLQLVDGMVIPEHSFRRARAFIALQDGKEDTESYFLRPDGLSAKHRDGSEIKIDAQLRVVQSDPTSTPTFNESVIEEEDDISEKAETQPELVYALWITYSRYIHANRQNIGQNSPLLAGSQTPLHQPSPGQTEVANPIDMDSDDSKQESHAFMLATQLKAAAKKTAAKVTGRDLPPTPQEKKRESKAEETGHAHKKCIEDFAILEEMGQGAYGQVKLARYKKNGNKKMVLKYVTKRRILVDTWTRDRKLGTVPLEIHVLDYLRRDGLRHPNIVEMVDFFEDDVNYYIEMLPHGLPGMDLFDYIELRVNMTEDECRSIFGQVAQAIHHLHTRAQVVHRDIKDENVVLDGEGNIKLIDFGSAAYTKNGPFDVFVGTIGKLTLHLPRTTKPTSCRLRSA